MSRPERPEINVHLANTEYQDIKIVFDKKLNNLNNLTIDKFKEYEMNFVTSIKDWSQEEKRKYINTFVEPPCYHSTESTDIEKEVKIKKELKNNILKEATIHTHAIINKYFNIITINASDDDYINFYNKMNFCLVLLYIEPNKKSLERLLVAYKKLIKTIWP